jgi:hypothetical protein
MGGYPRTRLIAGGPWGGVPKGIIHMKYFFGLGKFFFYLYGVYW